MSVLRSGNQTEKRRNNLLKLVTKEEVGFLEEELVFLRFLLKHSNAPLFEEENEENNETEVWSVAKYMIYELEKTS